MAASQWLSLLGFSAKHNISLSTLRRRIKDNSIDFKMEKGKYFIFEQSVETKTDPIAVQTQAQHQPKYQPTEIPNAVATPTMPPSFVEASVLSSANRLVEELKAAYAKILQEKEEQISQLKDEIGDLRMLVKILEDQGSKKSGQFDFGTLDL